MHLIHILLPLNDNDGHRQPRELFLTVAEELTQKFGGLTAHTRAPAKGVWKSGEQASRDEIVIYEVMTQTLDEDWWHEYRRGLEGRFRQEQVVIRAQEIRLL